MKNRSLAQMLLTGILALAGSSKARSVPTILKLKPELAGYMLDGYHLKNGKSHFSKIGGLPDLPDSTEWPEWQSKPLSFIAQLKLSEINTKKVNPLVPDSGLIYFFYDQAQSTWGYDPKDKGSWKAVFIQSETQRITPAKAPKNLGVIYKERRVSSKLVATYPSWESERVKQLSLNDEEFELYDEFRSSFFGQAPRHLFLGYPNSIQSGNMDLESELVTNGLYCGDESGYNDPKAKLLEKNRSDWMLFLQIDSDEKTGMMWGDGGMLYFWINKKDLEKKDFSRVWMILQCG